MTIQEQFDVIKAAADGKTVQQRYRWWTGWNDVRVSVCDSPSNLTWEFAICEYRVKAEPRRVWVNRYPDGVAFLHLTKEEADRNKLSTGTTTEYVEVLK